MVAHGVLTAYSVKRKRQAAQSTAPGTPAMSGAKQVEYGGGDSEMNDQL